MSDDDEVLRRRIGDADVVREGFDDLPVPALVMEGPEHRLVAANAAYRALVGRSDFIDEPVRSVFPDLIGQHVFHIFDRVYETGEPYQLRGWRINLVFEDGSEPNEIFFDGDFVPRFTEDGTVHGIVCTVSDVTPQVRTRLAAQEQAEATERRFEQARDVIAAMQRELLPRGLPVLPRVRIAGTYLLADADTAAGGDWFDALALPDGRVGLVVGDVVGHGVAASAVMGQLRAILAERLGAGAAISDALAAVDAAAGRIHGARAATVCVAALDPTDGTLSYCTAGHPPPLLLPASGEPRFLPSTGAGPLGTGSAFPLGADRLDSHDMVLLYTDGILERPGLAPSAATVELTQTAADVAAGKTLRDQGEPVERVCTQTLELLVRATGHSDDITLLAAQRTPTVPDLHAEHPADTAAVPALRATLHGWLGDLGVSEADTFALVHGIGELVANAVQHARPAAAAATVTLHAALSPDGVLHAQVRDQGRWWQRRSGPIPGDETRMPLLGRGRGLEMVRGLLDTLHVEPGPDGTTVGITHRLTWPARLLTTDEVHSGAAPAAARRPDTARLRISNQPTGIGTRLRLDGPLDAATASGLEIELRRRTRGGTQAVTLDLTGVTHLASAGVAVLHAVKGLRFFAPAGSVAQQVLTLVALPHLNRDPDHTDDTTPVGLPGWPDDTRSGGEHAGGYHVEDDEVHQATGVLMTQLGVSAADALARLRAHAFAHDRLLRDVARDVIEGRLQFTDDMT